MTVTALPNEEKARGGSRTRLIIIGVVVLVLLAVVAYLLLKPKSAATDASTDPSAPPTYTEADYGAVQTVDSVQINLADGHYLNVSIALQLTKNVPSGEGASGVNDSEALDALIHVFTNQPLDKLTQPADIDTYVAELTSELQERYPDEVAKVYLRQFVTQ